MNSLHSSFWDVVMFYSTKTITWLPLYLVITFYLFKKFGWQQALFTLLFISFLIAASDQGSVHFFKNVFQRLRPCHDPNLAGLVHQVNDKCGGRFGFISSHASNTFATAIFISLLFNKKWLWIGMITWASFVSYTRIYLGVHYPGDILGGTIWGILIGYVFYRIYKKSQGRCFGCCVG
ncbi:MAG: phosphatase PAP2 family protein [Bacteroidales bacterium]|nr:phosphatase PAP2 family protein [Bacteroidales bacterium]MCF8457891.1 phosphatase PAP2 family protein [Bacteroidales bacterium]